MERLNGVEIRQSEKFPLIWVTQKMRVYSICHNLKRELKHEEDKNFDRIVKAACFKGGWCYVGELMAECWEDQHKENIKNGTYNNMKKPPNGKNSGDDKVHIWNSASLCIKYGLTSYELRDIVETASKRPPTAKTKIRKDSVKDSDKREQKAKERKEAMEESKETGLRYPKNYEAYDRVPSISLKNNNNN
jgi:hypothetical protein